MRTDETGRVEVGGFPGRYELRRAGRMAFFVIAAPGRTATTLRL